MARWGALSGLCIALIFGVLCPLLVRAAEASFGVGEFIAISYRDIEDRDPDQRFGGLETAKLAEEFDWLRAHGYQPVSLDTLAAAAQRGTLPPKPVLLTFEDGWESFYTRVFPLLQAYHYPAVVGVVAPWATAPSGSLVHYAGLDIPREHFMSREQIRELARSGLVEFASQPRDRTQSSADDGAYLQQMRADLAAASDLVQQETGRMARGMVWPRREDSGQAAFFSSSLGFTFVLTAEQGRASSDRLSRIPRRLVDGNPGMGEFIDQIVRLPPPPGSAPVPAAPTITQPKTAR